MTLSGENATPVSSDYSGISKKSDLSQNFLRAARAGNLPKVLDFFAKHDVDIHSCNANGLNALHLASKEGHVEVVRELLARGADPNRSTRKGNTALHIASLAGQLEVVKLLMDAEVAVNTQAQNGFTPLYMAAQENHLEVVNLLLANHANPALTTDDGFTPLAVALQQGHDRIVALLLEHDSRGKVCLPALHIAAKKDDLKAANLLLNSDVNVDHQSASGFTPLHIAAHYGNINMTELLISRGADINFQAKNNITPLHVACKWGNSGVAERLIAAGAQLDCHTRDGLTPLHCAARSGYDVVVKLLLASNANLNVKTRSGLNALHMAAQGDHVDVARLLLQNGMQVDDVTIDYLTPLHVASHCGNIQMVKLLLSRGSDINARALNGFTSLHIACQKNRIKVVEVLLKYNCLIDATTESGLTPLHVASYMGHLNIVVLLLQHGAGPNTPTVRGETALHLAARAGQTEVARLLLRNGAQVDARARGHQTPLHIVSRIGNTDLVSLLLEHSAYVQAAAKGGHTPLHLAVKGNHPEVCKLLLNADAQLETMTRSGFTALHLAIKHLYSDVATQLVSHGANVNASGRNGLTPLHLATHYGSINLVQLLLAHKANPLDQAKNGYTALHIAAEKRSLDIAKLLIAGMHQPSGCEVESRNGFTALHLACQDGSADMTQLLLKSGSLVNARAKNGLTPMHLAAQEDCIGSAELLCAAGSELDAKTKAGYTPLHTACHFGQTNMVRFLLGKRVNVNAQTCLGSNALHLAAQQGHAQVVYILLESGADPNMRNKYNWTPAHVARRQHYLNIFEVLRQVTTCVESWEAEADVDDFMTDADLTKSAQPFGTRHLLEQPDVMGDHAVTDTEEECFEPDYTDIPTSPLFTRSVDHMRSGKRPSIDLPSHVAHKSATDAVGRMAPDKLSNMSGEDSIHENPMVENGPNFSWRDGSILNGIREPLWTSSDKRHEMASYLISGVFSTTDWDFTPDNVPIARKPVTSGFLVSFLVDARGGSMRGSRHAGLRVLVPPSAASAPTRVTCRMLRPERTTRPPQLNDSEGLACRIIELGPHPCAFNSPVLLEIPHFASLRGRQRELVVLRSDNGETWREHSLEATDQAVQSALGQNFEGLETLEELREKRIIRILTNDFPQYLAIVSRLRQETAMIGSDGGVLSSTVVPQVQAVFPEGALQKRIRVGLQAQPISPDLVSRLLGNRVAVSPIVTLEPRRRKFHKPITLTIPLPKSAHRGMTNQPANDLKTQGAPRLRLLCSITGGTLPAQWEDITVPTPLSRVKDCVSFTTTVSARFWLMDCPTVHDSTELATILYREASVVPYMGKFVVFAKRLDAEEALIRCFCVTDDKVDKTLECQESFEIHAASPEVEVMEARPAWLEAAGNLQPVTKSGDQLSLHFNAFHENRLAFPVRVRDMQAEPTGKFAFMREPRSNLQAANAATTDPARTTAAHQKPICTLEVNLGLDHGTKVPDSAVTDLGVRSLSDQLNTSAGASLHSIPCVFPQPRVNGDETLLDNLYGSKGRLASIFASDVIAKSQLDLLQVAGELGSDWPKLVGIILPDSNLDSTCTVDQLVDWIRRTESSWQHDRGESATGGAGGLSGLTVADLHTDRDQALALLLAWREQRGDLATGNELDRALRSIGRMDVVKSCMRDIQCVTEEDEHAEASKRIDQVSPPHPAAHIPLSEPLSTSLVGTATFMSGMEELPVEQSTEMSVSSRPEHHEIQPEEMEIVQAKEASHLESAPEETIEQSPEEHVRSIEPREEVPYKSDEPSGVEEPEEPGEYVEENWQSGSPPASTTSQQGGDPLLLHVGQEIIDSEDADIVRDSESMTASMEEPPENAADVVLKEEATRSIEPTEARDTSTHESPSEDAVGGTLHDEENSDNLESSQGTTADVTPDAERNIHLPETDVVPGLEVEGNIADAHHMGGERPPSELSSLPVKCFSEEAVEQGEEDAVHPSTDEHTKCPDAQTLNLNTAHHGVVSEHPES